MLLLGLGPHQSMWRKRPRKENIRYFHCVYLRNIMANAGQILYEKLSVHSAGTGDHLSLHRASGRLSLLISILYL